MTLSLFFFICFWTCVWLFCIHECICTTCMSEAYRGQKRVSDAEMNGMNHHVGPGETNLGPLEKHECSEQPSQFSNPANDFLKPLFQPFFLTSFLHPSHFSVACNLQPTFNPNITTPAYILGKVKTVQMTYLIKLMQGWRRWVSSWVHLQRT